jgi:hypothetical protein
MDVMSSSCSQSQRCGRILHIGMPYQATKKVAANGLLSKNQYMFPPDVPPGSGVFN